MGGPQKWKCSKNLKKVPQSRCLIIWTWLVASDWATVRLPHKPHSLITQQIITLVVQLLQRCGNTGSKMTLSANFSWTKTLTHMWPRVTLRASRLMWITQMFSWQKVTKNSHRNHLLQMWPPRPKKLAATSDHLYRKRTGSEFETLTHSELPIQTLFRLLF